MKKSFLLLILGSISLFSFGQIKESSKIDSLFRYWDKPDVPGCVIGIIQEGKLVYTHGYGSGNLDYKIPLSADSKFYIASTSKQFTAACIALLSIEGKIGLDDEVQKYIPELPKYQDKITVRNLIHHTSGLRDYLGLMYLSGESYEDYFTINDGIELLIKQKAINFSPGDEYLYSNSGYILLAEIVNRVSGMTIREYADKNIFEPLGMINTFFNDDHSQITENRVISYRKESGTLKRFVQNFDALGDGNLITTVNDIYLWDQNFYHHKVGGKEFVDLILNQGKLNNGDTLEYAFGLAHGRYKGLKTVSHGGAFLGFRTQVVRFPEQKFSVIVFSNVSDFDPTNMAYQITDIFLDDILIETPKKTGKVSISETINELNLNQLTGSYEVQAGVVLEITVKNDSLHVLQNWNNSSYNITNTTANTYEIPNEPSIQFVFSELKDDFAQILTVYQNGNETICKRKGEIEISNLNLNDFTGDFYSDELDATYMIFLEDEKLKVKVANYDPLELKIYEIDAFTSGGNLIRFDRENGIIRGFELDSGRIKNLKFHKK